MHCEPIGSFPLRWRLLHLYDDGRLVGFTFQRDVLVSSRRAISEIRLVNHSTGDPVLYVDYPGTDNALLFDSGENCALDKARLADLEAVFITHHHVDHFVGFDRVMRANIDVDKTLHIFGPVGTIQRVYQRVTAYLHPFLPFQKCVFRVHELDKGKMRVSDLITEERFPEPVVEERTWRGKVIYENPHLKVEAVASDHTVPCLAYAMVEKTGYHPEPDKLRTGALRPGKWVQETLALLRADAPPNTVLEIDGGRFTLAALRDGYFSRTPGARIAFVTDTLWSEELQPALVQLARGASQLYCDSYYSIKEQKQADKHKHMTATHAAQLADRARVDELILMHFAPRYAGNYNQLVEEAREIFPRVRADIPGERHS